MTAFAYVKVPTEIVNTHADPGEWAELQCFGAMQPDRGHFASRAVMETVLGRGRARRCVDRGDVQALADGRWGITDWDFQEGDHTVADRMKRWRTRQKERGAAGKLFTLTQLPGRNARDRHRDTVPTVSRDTAR